MPYIGKVKLSDEWTSLQSLVREQISGQSTFEFDGDLTYQLQAEGNLGARLCEATSIPTDVEDGFEIKGTQDALYKPSTGVVYVKVGFVGKLTDAVLLKISSLG